MSLISSKSVTPHLSEIEFGYVNYMGDASDTLKQLLLDDLYDGYDELELIYFIEYIICDSFRLGVRRDGSNKPTTQEYRKWHLFSELSKMYDFDKQDNKFDDIDNISVLSTNRINEYKNQFPTSQYVGDGGKEISENFIQSSLHNMYPFEHIGSRFNIKLWMTVLTFITEYQREQTNYVVEQMKNF